MIIMHVKCMHLYFISKCCNVNKTISPTLIFEYLFKSKIDWWLSIGKKICTIIHEKMAPHPLSWQMTNVYRLASQQQLLCLAPLGKSDKKTHFLDDTQATSYFFVPKLKPFSSWILYFMITLVKKEELTLFWIRESL